MAVPIVCDNCGMQTWYFEDALNIGTRGLFDIPELFRPSFYECEEMAEFCPHCGHPKQLSYRRQMSHTMVAEEYIFAKYKCEQDLPFTAAVAEAFWQDYSSVKDKMDTLLLLIDLFRRRQYQSEVSRNFLLDEYRRVIQLLENLQQYIELAPAAKLRY